MNMKYGRKHDLKWKTSKKLNSILGFFLDHMYSIIALTLPERFYRPKKKADTRKKMEPKLMNVIKSPGLFLNVDVSKLYMYLKQI